MARRALLPAAGAAGRDRAALSVDAGGLSRLRRGDQARHERRREGLVPTARDFSGESGLAFAWNEWERQSIEAAEGDEELERRVVAFWDSHLPILLSVKSGYAYFAIEQSSLRIVRGEEPEYEEATPLAPSFTALLQLIKGRDRRLSLWI